MNPTHVFVVNVDQFAEVLEQDWARTTVCVSSDPEVLGEADRHGLPRINLWEYHSGEMLDTFEWDADALQQRFAQAMEGALLLADCDLLERCFLDLHCQLRTLLAFHYVLTACFKEHRPARVACFRERARANYWFPESYSPDVFNAMVALVAREQGTPVTLLEQTPAGSAASAVPSTPVFTGRRRNRLSSTPVEALSFCSGPLARAEQGRLFDTHYQPTFSWGAVAGMPPEAPYPFLDLAALERLPWRLDSVDEGLRRVKAILPERLSSVEDVPRWFFAAELAFVWEEFLTWVRAAARRWMIGQLVARGIGPKLVLTGYDACGSERCLQQALLDAGVEVASVDHWAAKYPITHVWNRGARAHCMVIGEMDRQGQEGMRAPTVEVVPVGCLKHSLEARDLSLECGESAAEVPRRVVIFTSDPVFPEAMWGYGNPETVLESWKRVVELMRARPDWSFVIKTHPRYDRMALHDRERFDVPDHVEVMTGNPRAALEGAGVALLFCSPSWVLPEIIAAGVPVVYLRDAVFTDPTPYIDSTGVQPVDDPGQLEAVLEGLMTDVAVRKERLRAASAFLDRMVPVAGEDAVARINAWMTDRLDLLNPKPADESCWAWLCGLLDAVGRLQRGETPWADFLEELDELDGFPEWQPTSFLPYLEGPALHRVLMGEAMWIRRPPQADWSHLALNRTMLTRISVLLGQRPTWGAWRSCMVLGALRDLEGSPRGASAWGRRLMVLILAPGRVLRHGFESPEESIPGS